MDNTQTGPRFERTAYGYYRRAGATSTTGQQIIDVVAGLPEGALVTGWAAAYVHGVDLTNLEPNRAVTTSAGNGSNAPV